MRHLRPLLFLLSIGAAVWASHRFDLSPYMSVEGMRALVDGAGCSVCPCSAGWFSHQAYLDCVTYEANLRFKAGTLTRKQRTAAITHAKNSTCGDSTLTRCCVWRKVVYGSLGTCLLTRPADCTYAVQGKWAEDRSPGSCYYNPCIW